MDQLIHITPGSREMPRECTGRYLMYLPVVKQGSTASCPDQNSAETDDNHGGRTVATAKSGSCARAQASG